MVVTASMQPFLIVSLHQLQLPTGGVLSVAAAIGDELPKKTVLASSAETKIKMRFTCEWYLYL
jgi:hypothetical protein